MAITRWSISGREFTNCNCAYGCPCQFNALPTHGHCCAASGFVVDRGSYADVKLDGLRAVALYSWPGPVHMGNGTMQMIVDERADARQRAALVAIMSGGDTEDTATMWWIFNAMCPTRHEPLFLPITLEMDQDERTAHLLVQGIVESHGEPIRNPVTGVAHRARIELPHGFEYRVAEVASGTTRATGAVKLDFTRTHAHFAHLNLSQAGVTA